MKRRKIKKQESKIRTPPEKDLVNLLKHYQAGRLSEAENMALLITKKYPKHQFGWKVLGSVLKQTGRISDSLLATKKSVILAPKDEKAHYNLGNTYTQLSRLEEAEQSYRKAVSLKPDFVEGHYNLGNTLKELGNIEEANVSYRQTISLKPDYAEAYNNLGITTQLLGKLNEAVGIFKQATLLKPDFASAYQNLGIVLKELGRFKDAEVSFKQAISLSPENSEIKYYLGLFLYGQGRYEEAIEQFSFSDFEKSKSYLLRCLYLEDKKTHFFDQLDTLIIQGDIDPMIGSLGCRSLLRYGIDRPNLFCKEPLKYVSKIDLKDQYDFREIFVNATLDILNDGKTEYRSTGLLTNGSQTYGNIFDLQLNLTQEIQKIIRIEVEKYRFNFKDSEEGLITNWPENYDISGWLIRMQNGGELQPHMHEGGWISGSVYINVPPKMKSDSGNLVVSIEDENFISNISKNAKNVIDVVTGSLVLFPASLLHHTIPFESEEERIVLAFDVVPN